jgi:hypothetical protein
VLHRVSQYCLIVLSRCGTAHFTPTSKYVKSNANGVRTSPCCSEEATFVCCCVLSRVSLALRHSGMSRHVVWHQHFRGAYSLQLLPLRWRQQVSEAPWTFRYVGTCVPHNMASHRIISLPDWAHPPLREYKIKHLC